MNQKSPFEQWRENHLYQIAVSPEILKLIAEAFQGGRLYEMQPFQNLEWAGLTPLNIEDEYVCNYLWERALIAVDDPCCRSHPHENMNEYCQRRTELARYQAKLKEKNT